MFKLYSCIKYNVVVCLLCVFVKLGFVFMIFEKIFCVMGNSSGTMFIVRMSFNNFAS